MPLRQPGNIGVQEIPGISSRAIQDDGRLESRGVVEAADIDADKLRFLVRLVVDRDTAVSAKAFSLGRAAVGASRDFAHLAADIDRIPPEHEYRTVPAAGILLAVAALTLKAPNGFCSDGEPDRAAGAAAGKAHDLISPRSPQRSRRDDMATAVEIDKPRFNGNWISCLRSRSHDWLPHTHQQQGR